MIMIMITMMMTKQSVIPAQLSCDQWPSDANQRPPAAMIFTTFWEGLIKNVGFFSKKRGFTPFPQPYLPCRPNSPGQGKNSKIRSKMGVTVWKNVFTCSNISTVRKTTFRTLLSGTRKSHWRAYRKKTEANMITPLKNRLVRSSHQTCCKNKTFNS